MRTGWLCVFVPLVSSAALVLAAKSDTAAPSGGAERAEDVRTVRIEMSFAGQEEQDDPNPDRYAGSAEVWFDIDRKQYGMHIVMTETRAGRVGKKEANIVCVSGDCVTWEVKDGKAHEVKREKVKEAAGGEPALESAHDVGPVMVPLVDAAFGWKRLKSEAIMEEANSPLAEKDTLRWHRVKPKAGDDKPGLAEALGLYNEASVWLGVSPETGWPMKYAVQGKQGEYLTFTVTKVDVKADLKDAFELPAEVKAKLDELKAKQGEK